MGDYVKKPSIHPRDRDLHALLQRLVKNTAPQTPQPPQPATIDTASIVDAVSKAIENNLKNVQLPVYNLEKGSSDNLATDSFDDSKSLAKLADSMIVQRGNSQSNFDDLGGVNTSKKDSKETQNTIDLLKNLED